MYHKGTATNSQFPHDSAPHTEHLNESQLALGNLYGLQYPASGHQPDLQGSNTSIRQTSIGFPLASAGSSNSDGLLPHASCSSAFATGHVVPYSVASTQQQALQLPPPLFQPRPRQHMTLPAVPAFLASEPHMLSLTSMPPLFSSPDELRLLEPRDESRPTSFDSKPNLGSIGNVSDLLTAQRSRAEVYRRTVSSPTALGDLGRSLGRPIQLPGSTGAARHSPFTGSTSSSLGPHSNMDPRLSASFGGLALNDLHMHPISSTARPSPAINATINATSLGMAEDTGMGKSLHAAAATACQAMAGASANTIDRMVAELPPELQPIVMAKLSVRGRGGRRPAADPRSVDPNMDEKKVRRILANRQSAARSKLKSRVLLETLRVGKDMMAERQETVQEELTRLTNLVKELEAHNAQLEERLALSEQSRGQQLQQHQQRLQQLQHQYQHGQAQPGEPIQPQNHPQHEQLQLHPLPEATTTAAVDVHHEDLQLWWDDEDMQL